MVPFVVGVCIYGLVVAKKKGHLKLLEATIVVDVIIVVNVVVLVLIEVYLMQLRPTSVVVAKLSPSSSLANPSWGLSLVLIWLPPAPTHPPTHPSRQVVKWTAKYLNQSQ